MDGSRIELQLGRFCNIFANTCEMKKVCGIILCTTMRKVLLLDYIPLIIC